MGWVLTAVRWRSGAAVRVVPRAALEFLRSGDQRNRCSLNWQRIDRCAPGSASADGVLRQAPWVVHQLDSRRTLLRLFTYLVLFGLIYGAAMGSFRAIASQPQWARQMLYSAVKVPLLLSASFVISLPSFFVLNSLLGLAARFCAGRAGAGRGAGRAGDHSGVARAVDVGMVCVIERVQRGAAVQRGDVRRGQFKCAVVGARLLSPARGAESTPPLAVVGMAGRLHVGGDTDGVAAAAVRGFTDARGRVLPTERLGQRVCNCRAVGLAYAFSIDRSTLAQSTG